MKKIRLLVLLVLFYPGFIKAQSGWQWGAGGAHVRAESEAATIDRNGNTIVCGKAMDDSLTLAGTTYYSAGGFVSKINSSGTFLWAKEMDYTNGLNPMDVCTDAAGNIYMLGIYQGSLPSYPYSFSLGAYTFTKPYGYGMYFLAKFSTDGDIRWVKEIAPHDVSGALASSYYGDVGTDSAGNVYITGIFNTPTDTIGSVVVHNHSGGSYDAFLARLDSSGNVTWAKNVGSYSEDNVAALSVSNNTIYITGQYQGATLYADGVSTITKPVTADFMGFAAAFSLSGTLKWAKNTGMNVMPVDMRSDALGAAYITGAFAGTVTMGAATFASSGYADMFLIKYDSSGNVAWAKAGSGPGVETPYSLDLDNTCGNVWICGYVPTLPYTMNFQGGHTLSISSGYDPLYIVGFGTDGTYKTSMSLPAGGEDFCGLTAQNGNVYIVGDYQTYPLIINHDTLKLRPPLTAIVEYLFVAKYTYVTTVSKITDTVLCRSAMESGAFYGPSDYITYLWSTGSNIQSAHIDSSGTYWLTATGGACGTLNDTFHISLVDTYPPCIHTTPENVADAVSANTGDVSLFPNPVGQALTIRSVTKIANVTITNPLGKTIYTHGYNKNEVTIDVSKLPAGVYFACINGSETRKFVKE